MTDLDLEHCEKLKDWGMLQELEYGDWCWVPVTDGHLVIAGHPDAKYVRVMKYHSKSLPPKYFKIPSLDALLEFAKTLDPPKTFALVWEAADNTWAVVRTWDKKGGVIRKWITPRDDTAKLAVYALIAKLKEVESV